MLKYALRRYLASRTTLYVTAVISTIFMTYWLTSSIRLINTDALLYLRVAQAYLDHGFNAAYDLYRWPFYSCFIAIISQIFSISLTMAAYVVNILLQIIMAWAFLHLIRSLGGNIRCQWFALIILLAHPALNDYRSFIIRDFGFWAFYLVGLIALLRLQKRRDGVSALFWCSSFIVATLFRIEGLVFFIALPFALLFNRNETMIQRLRTLIYAQLPLLIVTIIVLISLYFFHSNFHEFGRLHEVYYAITLMPGVLDNVSDTISQVKTSVLTYQSQRSGSIIVIAGLVGLLLVEIVKVTNILFCALSHYAARKRLIADSGSRKVLQGAIFINLALLLYFVGSFLFLSGRYIIPLSLIFLLWTPFAIEYFYQLYCVSQWRVLKHWYYFALLFVLSGYIIYNMLNTNVSKAYVKEAGIWMQKHLPGDAVIASNSAEILYYSKPMVSGWRHDYSMDVNELLTKLKKYDYIALRQRRRQHIAEIAEQYNLKPYKIFVNKRGDKVYLYKIDRQSKPPSETSS